MAPKNSKTKVAALSVLSNTTLIILKVGAGILSGSVSIISEAIHSGMDLIAAIIAFFSVRVSSNPADEDHPYGHGKVENISGVVEGLLILIAAVLIIVEAVKKILHPAEISETWPGIAVMLFSALVNTIVASVLYKVAKREDSVALEADALHLKTDVYTSLGVGGGLLLIKFTGVALLDPIVAILVALLIVKEGWHLTRNAFTPLLDASLPASEQVLIKETLERYKDKIIDFHGLKTRKSGNARFIDLHLTVLGDLTVAESHALSKEVELELQHVLKNVDVNIHIDPDKR